MASKALENELEDMWRLRTDHHQQQCGTELNCASQCVSSGSPHATRNQQCPGSRSTKFQLGALDAEGAVSNSQEVLIL